MDVQFRKIYATELAALLDLYTHLHTSDAPLPDGSTLERVWHAIITDPKIFCLVGEYNGSLVASCTLVAVPNLTRGACPYGLIENVVTHRDYRRQGLGTRLLHYALQIARTENCYKVMLLTGRKDEATLRFYAQAGFESGSKTGFVAKFASEEKVGV